MFQAMRYNILDLPELHKGSIVNQKYQQALLKSANQFQETQEL